MNEQEKQELLAYDKAVEKGERTEFDLAPDKKQNVKLYTTTGTRKNPTGYKFSTRSRKPNELKGGLIAELANFLETLDGIENLTIANKEKLITFSMGGQNFDLDLKQKRKAKGERYNI